MVDTLTPEARSKLMSKICPKNTLPELRVRSLLHRMGFRFGLHRRDLPGTPDIVLPARNAVVFVNGCFWHGHGCKYGRLPATRLHYWVPKIEETKRRDARKRRQLTAMGWSVVCVRECELRNIERLRKKLLIRLNAVRP